jgi:hypothetical protein
MLTKPRPSACPGAAVLFAAALAVIAGCSSKPAHSTSPAPRQDVSEYRQVATDARHAVQATLVSLNRTASQAPCPPRVIRAFSNDVQRLEVDSFRLRARARAIRARGQAYFDQWQEHLSGVQDPAARQLAEQRRDRLQEQFARIRAATQQAHAAFQPFLAGLHRLRNGLENDPAIASTAPMKEVIRTTREEGEKVQASLDDILVDLDAVAAILKPERAARKDWML